MKEAHKPGATVVLTDRAGNVLHAKNFCKNEIIEAQEYFDGLEWLNIKNCRLSLLVYSEIWKYEYVDKVIFT